MIAEHLIPVQTYKEPVEFADKQLKIFWLPDEVNVEKDVQDILVNMSATEKHGIITTLKLFSLYETHAGSEYWGGRFKTMFDGAEFHRMASVFSMFELAVHAPFYNKINQLLHLDDQSFYLSYLDSPVLKARMEFIDDVINDHNPLVSLAGFSMVEGVILYSSFAYLKHYQSNGKNKLTNIVRGINFSLRDENLHSVAGAWCFKLLKSKEKMEPFAEFNLKRTIFDLAEVMYEHECHIVDMTFEKGSVEGITPDQVKAFVRNRINVCLTQLGYDPFYPKEDDEISSWFYKAINDYSFNDFFSGMGNQYHRNWDSTRFTW